VFIKSHMTKAYFKRFQVKYRRRRGQSVFFLPVAQDCRCKNWGYNAYKCQGHVGDPV
jgi:hypothetical protein